MKITTQCTKPSVQTLTNKELQKIHNEEDMLKGNINRMCVTHDLQELLSMHDYAIKRIGIIFQINYERIYSSMKPLKMTERISNQILNRESKLKLIKEYCDMLCVDLEQDNCDRCLIKEACNCDAVHKFEDFTDGLIEECVDLIKKK